MQCNQRGFSLIEVLVALVILAVIMLSVAELCAHSIRFSQHMRQRLDAKWIAQNALADLQLGLSSLPNDSGSQSADETMDNTVWTWTATISKSTEPGFVKVKIAVNDKNNSNEVFHFQGFAKGGSK